MDKKFLLRSELSYRYILHGKGIEIGATFLPLPLMSGVKVKYIDVIDEKKLVKLYPDLKTRKPVHVDIIDDAEKLEKIPNNSQDFIIANHFIEHAINPIGTIENFLRKLKDDGIIFMAVPEMRATFDKDRPLTDVNHLIQVYRKGFDPDRYAHYEECVRLIEKRPESEVKSRVDELIKTQFSVHYHTYTLSNFRSLVEYMRKIGIPVYLVACEDLQEGTDEFIVVLQKSYTFKSYFRERFQQIVSAGLNKVKSLSATKTKIS